MTTMTDWIRPWYPGGASGDHTDPDCPTLTQWTSAPAEGTGWLNPSEGDVCAICQPPWNASCTTCGASMNSDEYVDKPHSESKAKRWLWDHTCRPDVRLIPPPRAEQPAADHPTLFDLEPSS